MRPERVRQRGRFLESGRVSDCGLALTLLIAVPLIPMEAFARVVLDPRIDPRRQFIPFPQRAARIPALDTAVQIVPVVQDACFHLRLRRDLQPIDWLASLDQRKK